MPVTAALTASQGLWLLHSALVRTHLVYYA